MDALTKLCQDIPHLVSQNWMHNALTELFTQFLDHRNNEQIRLKCVTFLFVVINCGRNDSHKEYISCLKYSCNFSAFCFETQPYDRYYNNFKKDFIKAQTQLPWSRMGKSKSHTIRMLNTLLTNINMSTHFPFWFSFIVKHIYPRLYYKCYYEHFQLILQLFEDTQNNASSLIPSSSSIVSPCNTNNINIRPVLKRIMSKNYRPPEIASDVEKEGFGSYPPPSAIHSIIVDWLCTHLNNESKAEIIHSREIYILFSMKIFEHCMTLPVNYHATIYRMLRHIEHWILGLNISGIFVNNIQYYLQHIIQYLFSGAIIHANQVSPQKLSKKLNLCGFIIYLLRLIIAQPFVNLSSNTWKVLITCTISCLKTHMQCYIQNTDVIIRLYHPLIYFLFQSLLFCSISNAEIANELWNIINNEMSLFLSFEPFVVQWREILRNFTIHVLAYISTDANHVSFMLGSVTKTEFYRIDASTPRAMDEQKSNFNFVTNNNNLTVKNSGFRRINSLDLPLILKNSSSPDIDDIVHNSDLPFNIEYRLNQLSVEAYAFVSIDQAFMIWDRLLRMLGPPLMNTELTHYTHLEGFTDALKIFLISLHCKPPSKKALILNLQKKKSSGSKIRRPSKIGNSLYGFSHSILCGPIHMTSLAYFPSAIQNKIPLPPREQLPQSRTLMLIFGPWLFDICLSVIHSPVTNQVSHLKQFAIAFSSLSNVFFDPSQLQFDSIHLASFYKIIKLVLSSNVSQKIRAVVIHECAKGCIFGKNLAGSDILIPSFLEAMQNICGYDPKTFAKYAPRISSQIFTQNEACDCLTIGLSLICFASHFNTTPINNKKSKKHMFSYIKLVVTDMFCMVSHVDGLNANVCRTIIWGLVQIIYDEVSSTRDTKIVSTALRAIVDAANINRLEIASIAVNAIAMLSPICVQICHMKIELISVTLLPAFLSHTMEYVNNSSIEHSNRQLICNICTQMLYCLLEWTFVLPSKIFCNHKLMNKYFQIIHNAILLESKIFKFEMNDKKSHHKKSSSNSKQNSKQKSNVCMVDAICNVVTAARSSKMILFNYLGNYPLTHDSGAFCSNANFDIIDNADDQKRTQITNVYLAYDRSVVMTVMDEHVNDEQPSNSVKLLLRDESGKLAWNFHPCSIAAHPQKRKAESLPMINIHNRRCNDSIIDCNNNIIPQKKSYRHKQRHKKSTGVRSVSSSPSRMHSKGVKVKPYRPKYADMKEDDIHSKPPLMVSFNLCDDRCSSAPASPAPPSLDCSSIVCKLDDKPSMVKCISHSINDHKKSVDDNCDEQRKPVFELQQEARIRLWYDYESKNNVDDYVSDGYVSTDDDDAVLSTNLKNKSRFDINLSGIEDNLTQVLNYLEREFTPPATADDLTRIISKRPSSVNRKYRQKPHSKQIVQKTHSNVQKLLSLSNSGSFPSGYKKRNILAKYMHVHKNEECELFAEYSNIRKIQCHQLSEYKPMDDESKEVELKTNGRRIEITPFDCSRFLLSHLGILTIGHVLEVGDAHFSVLRYNNYHHRQYKISQQQEQSSFNHLRGIERKRSRSRSPRNKNGNHKVKKFDTMKIKTKSRANDPQQQLLSFKRMHSGSFEYDTNPQGFYSLDPHILQMNEQLLSIFDSTDVKFTRRLKLLDDGSLAREKHKIGILYVGPDQNEQRHILGNERGSQEYEKFVNEIGWKVDLLAHEGFEGGMNACTTGRYSTYYSTATYEMAFHVVTDMPTNHSDRQYTDKKKHVGNDHVNIIWSDHSREYISSTLVTQFGHVLIIIYPLNNGMFRIRIHKRKNICSQIHFGPLLNNMIVRRPFLATLVRLTALEANRAVRYSNPAYVLPFLERQKYLEELVDKNSRHESEAILGAFFPKIWKAMQ